MRLRTAGCGRLLPSLAFVVMLGAGSPRSSHADAFPDTIRFYDFEACGLQCLRPSCPNNGTTSLSGTIYAPNGTLPLPNVEVYVPNASVEAFVDGPNAPRCDQAPSGHPLVATLTDANGNFVLKDVPATTGVPVVVIAGKWRRQLTVDVPACTNTALDVTKTRLPKSHTEGDIAHIAVVTGSADAVECLMRKTGVVDSEFSTSSGSGRIHLFAGPGGGTNKFDIANGGASFASGTALWASTSTLSAYDQVVLGCDAVPNPAGSIAGTSLVAMQAYADAGGRVYLSHWNNYWVQSITAWPVATWGNLAQLADPVTAQVANDFPQAAIEYAWLLGVGASVSAGTLVIHGGRQTALSIDTNLARRWIYMDTTANNQPSMQLFTFTTPVAASAGAQVGRVLFTDMHDWADSSGTTKAFPSGGCGTATTTLSPQENALIYATFDLQRCVGSTKE